MNTKSPAAISLVPPVAAEKFGPCLAAFPEGERYIVRHLLDALRLPPGGDLADILTTAIAVAEDDLKTADMFERAGEACRAEERRQNVQAQLAAMVEFSSVAKAHAKKAGPK